VPNRWWPTAAAVEDGAVTDSSGPGPSRGTDQEDEAAAQRAGIGLALTEARRVRNSGRTEEASARFDAVLDTTARHDLPKQQAEAHVGLGGCAMDRGDLEGALSHYGKAERLLAAEPLPLRVPALRGRAIAHFMTGDLRYSRYLLENAVDELNSGGPHDPEALVLLYTALIAPYMDLGAHGRAEQAARLALDLAPRIQNPEAVASLHRTRARTLVAQGRTAEAEEALTEAQAVYQRLEIRTELAHCHWMRGYVRAQEGRLGEAEQELERARAILRSVGSQLYAVQVEVELADVWRRRGRNAAAAELLTAMLRELGSGRAAVHAAGAHQMLGSIREEAGDPGAAERHYRAALVLQRQAGAVGDQAETCRLLGDLLHGLGRTGEAIEVYRSGLATLSQPGATTLGPAGG
jgi:tetratricopeptide (TPR) repeat protein